MKTEKTIQLNMVIPERYRNLLRRLAAERMMANPEKNITGTGVATEMLLSALNDIGKFDYEEGGKKND